MQGIRAGLGHCVHDAARRLSKLRAIVGDTHGKLLYGIQAIDIRDASDRTALGFGEERLTVIGAIHRALVVETRNSAIGGQAGSAVGHHIRSEERESFPAPTCSVRSVRTTLANPVLLTVTS